MLLDAPQSQKLGWLEMDQVRNTLSKQDPGQDRVVSLSHRPSSSTYDAAACEGFWRAGGVQRKLTPSLFQTLIEAIAEVR